MISNILIVWLKNVNKRINTSENEFNKDHLNLNGQNKDLNKIFINSEIQLTNIK